MQYFKKKKLYFEPETLVLSDTKEVKCLNNVDRMVMVPVEGHFISLKRTLKMFFELPGVFETSLQYLKNSVNHSMLTSFFNGTTWKSMSLNFKNKTVFPLFLYYDDVELGNPLGSHSGIHKMGCIYYTVAALPSEFLSSLENIFVAFLFHSADRGQCKINNETMFSILVKELIELQVNGVQISLNSNDHTIYFCLGLVLGDNLGLNSILGFTESFSANYYCRICRSPKSDLQQMIKESELLRNKINYLADVLQKDPKKTGINELCIFNEVPNFNVVENIVCDFMHDIPEGVARYDMALIINTLITGKIFSLDFLNKRIQLFNYGFIERKNKPPMISINNLKNGCIIMSASEMLCLVRYFSFMIGELVPENTEVWKLYISLRNIICYINI